MADNAPVFVKIPASLNPTERREAYDLPLQRTLIAQRAGQVLGGGSQLVGDEELEIAWVGIEVALNDRQSGLRLLTAELLRLGAPKGTVIEHDTMGKPFVLALYPGHGWTLD